MDSGGNVKSMLRALELLSCFSVEKPEWGVTEIAEFLGLYKSTAHRVLKTFEHAKLLERTQQRRYRIGLRSHELGIIFRLSSNLISTAEEPLRQLANETGSITHLTRLDGRETIELIRASGKPSIAKPIIRRDAHATAVGKVLLAHADSDSFKRFIGMRQYLKRYTQHTIETPGMLWKQIQQVKSQRYAFDDQESCLGVRCLAVPVQDSSGAVVAAISISNSSERLTDQTLPRLLSVLLPTAKKIGRGLS